MTAAVIESADALASALRRGTPVRTADGKLGTVYRCEFKIKADGTAIIESYRLLMAEGRGIRSVPASTVTFEDGERRADHPQPKGAA